MKTALLSILMLALGVAIGSTLGRPEPPSPAGEDGNVVGVTGIGGVFFKARDPDALRAWYRDHLGLDADAFGTNFFWRESDAPGQFGRTVWSVFPDTTDYFGPDGSSWMLNYRVGDLDALLGRLADSGVEQVGQVEEYWYGRFAWILDGEGNQVELWEPVDYAPEEFARVLAEGSEAP